MKRVLTFVLLLMLSSLVISQDAKRRPEKKAQPKTLEGVTIDKNTATLNPGYEFVKLSNNVVAVKMKRKKKAVTGSLRYGCVGDGGCSLSTSGTIASCLGSCRDSSGGDGCVLYVEVGKKISVTPVITK